MFNWNLPELDIFFHFFAVFETLYYKLFCGSRTQNKALLYQVEVSVTGAGVATPLTSRATATRRYPSRRPSKLLSTAI